jgi:hypothetical protein
MTASLGAEENPLNLSGQLDLGYRYYFDDGQYDGQASAGFHEFAAFQLTGSFDVASGEVVLKFAGLSDDKNDRSILNIQKAYFTNSFENWDFVLGYNVENWGVSNGRTIVNVLNSKNRTNQVGNSDLIGTPLANANLFTDVGTISFYVLGDNVEGNFGGPATRLRGPFYSDDRGVRYENSNSTDVALRFSNSYSIGVGSLDLGASVYHGTGREALRMPVCIQEDSTVAAGVCDQFNADVLANYAAGGTTISSAGDAGSASLTALAPYYQEIRQYGLTAVYAKGDTQLRFEGFIREASDEKFSAAIVGGDRTFDNFMGGDGTLILAAEYHFDNRSDRQPLSVYDNDLFVGLNFSANDTNDSKIEIGMFYDLDVSSKIYSLSMSRRIGDRMRVSLNANHISADNAVDALSTVDGDSYVEFSLSTYF